MFDWKVVCHGPSLPLSTFPSFGPRLPAGFSCAIAAATSHGSDAAVFKPAQPTISLDGEPILLRSLDKTVELCMVYVYGADNAKP